MLRCRCEINLMKDDALMLSRTSHSSDGRDSANQCEDDHDDDLHSSLNAGGLEDGHVQ